MMCTVLMKILFFNQIQQMLKLMYYQSKKECNIKEPNRHTRAADKIVFDIPSRCTAKFLNSSYYIGSQLWDTLPGDTQRMENLSDFEKSISPLYKTYQM